MFSPAFECWSGRARPVGGGVRVGHGDRSADEATGPRRWCWPGRPRSVFTKFHLDERLGAGGIVVRRTVVDKWIGGHRRQPGLPARLCDLHLDVYTVVVDSRKAWRSDLRRAEPASGIARRRGLRRGNR